VNERERKWLGGIKTAPRFSKAAGYAGGDILSNRPIKKSNKSVSEPAQPPQVARQAGLCSACVHAPTCAYLKAHKDGAIFCEMYEAENPDGIEGNSDGPAVSFRSADNKVDPDKVYQGLCVNCCHRTTCALATSHGGVWHCEEYQLD
jgi:hypothetical protein